MNEMDIRTVLQSYKSGLDFAIEKIEAQETMIESLNEKIDSLEHVLYDEILSPAEEAMNAYTTDQRFGEFNNKYGEQLSSYNTQLAPLEDEGFDLSRATFDNYEQIPEEDKPEEEAYVGEVVRLAEEKIQEIRDAIGAPADADVVITSDAEGEAEVTVDGEPVEEGEPTSEEVTEDIMMGNTEEPEADNSEEADEDELAAYEEELRKEL